MFGFHLNDKDVVALLLRLFHRDLEGFTGLINNEFRMTHVVAVVHLTAVSAAKVCFALADAPVRVALRSH